MVARPFGLPRTSSSRALAAMRSTAMSAPPPDDALIPLPVSDSWTLCPVLLARVTARSARPASFMPASCDHGARSTIRPLSVPFASLVSRATRIAPSRVVPGAARCSFASSSTAFSWRRANSPPSVPSSLPARKVPSSRPPGVAVANARARCSRSSLPCPTTIPSPSRMAFTPGALSGPSTFA